MHLLSPLLFVILERLETEGGILPLDQSLFTSTVAVPVTLRPLAAVLGFQLVVSFLGPLGFPFALVAMFLCVSQGLQN